MAVFNENWWAWLQKILHALCMCVYMYLHHLSTYRSAQSWICFCTGFSVNLVC